MSNHHEENQIAFTEALAARAKAQELVNEALRYARQCKGENVDQATKQAASEAGKIASEARKEAKAASAKAASARRIACRVAMGPKEIPNIPRENFNGGKMPVPPHRRKKSVD